MSVRSVFGLINTPTSSEQKIPYVDGVGLVSLISGMSIAGDVGTANQVVGSDSAGGIIWRDMAGQGVVPNLAVVLQEGNICSADILLAGNNIESTADLRLTTPYQIQFNCEGILLGEEIGEIGQVLTTQGYNAVPTWTTPALGPATADLNMQNNDIYNVTALMNGGGPLQINASPTFPHTATFSVIPVCPVAPIGASDLTNKDYVDGLMASAGNVAPNVDNHWTALQSFTGGISLDTGALVSSAGAQIAIPGASYVAAATSQGSYYYTGGGAGTIGAQNNIWCIVWDTDGTLDISLPNADPGMNGASVTVFNMNRVGNGTSLRVNASPMYDCYQGGQDTVMLSVQFNRYCQVTFMCGGNPDGTASWLVTNISSANASVVWR
jgi:hypothetical protein